MNEPRYIAWLKLLRLPNVFTAVADVMMGFLVTQGALQPALPFVLLVGASGLLYLSGMVLNDVFDVEIDSRDRPERPIPSRRVSLVAAKAVGWGIWGAGIGFAWVASLVAGDWRPGVVGTLLGACVVLYDFTLKQTPVAPIVMGACRMLNVLLGMSLSGATIQDAGLGAPTLSNAWSTTEWLIALGIGIYIVGVTWFARTEARTSSRLHLLGATLLLIGGMALIALLPLLSSGDLTLVVAERGWYLLWAALALIIGRRCVLAILQPTPPRVQMAVRHCVHSLIMLDAAITIGYAGVFWGCAVLLLIFPTLLLTMWLNAT